jgi:type II secretory pathway pseudopilin PulG
MTGVRRQPVPLAQRRAFTLVETTVAVAVSSILLLSLGSVIVVAARAVPTGREQVVVSGGIERALAVLQADLEEATEIDLVGSTLAMAVPDRDADGVPEVIEFGRDAQFMLTRTHNRGTPEVLAGPIKDIAMDMREVDGRVLAVSVRLTIDGAEPSDRTLNVRLLNTPEVR